MYEETATESTISCIFLNTSDTSEKSCCITYGLCDKEMPQNQSLECNEHGSRIISDLVISGQQYCYTALASNGTYVVKVEGSFTAGITNNNLIYYTWHKGIPIPPGFDYLGNVTTTIISIVVPSIPCTCVACTTVMVIIVVVVHACIINRKERASQGYHLLINNEG